MKRSQIVLFGLFLLIASLIYIRLSSNKKEHSKKMKEEVKEIYLPIQDVVNSPQTISLISYGQVSPNIELIVSFEIQGKLLKGDLTMKPGTSFRAGQVLYQIDNEEAYFSFVARRAGLSTMILNAMPDIELDFPDEKNKWIKFLNALDDSKNLLPEFPYTSGKERAFVIGRNIMSEYMNLKSAEARLKKYVYTAPFNGTVIETFAEPSSIVNPGVQIAKIAKTNDFEVKVPIATDDLESYKDESSAEFTSPSGKKIATGKIIRISDVINQQTQSADVYYSISPLEGEHIYNGMYVNVKIDKDVTKNAVIIPRTAMKTGPTPNTGKVTILDKDKVLEKEVVIVGDKPDSIYVTGLKDNEKLILEFAGKPKKDVTYKGVHR